MTEPTWDHLEGLLFAATIGGLGGFLGLAPAVHELWTWIVLRRRGTFSVGFIGNSGRTPPRGVPRNRVVLMFTAQDGQEVMAVQSGFLHLWPKANGGPQGQVPVHYDPARPSRARPVDAALGSSRTAAGAISGIVGLVFAGVFVLFGSAAVIYAARLIQSG